MDPRDPYHCQKGTLGIPYTVTADPRKAEHGAQASVVSTKKFLQLRVQETKNLAEVRGIPKTGPWGPPPKRSPVIPKKGA